MPRGEPTSTVTLQQGCGYWRHSGCDDYATSPDSSNDVSSAISARSAGRAAESAASG